MSEKLALGLTALMLGFLAIGCGTVCNLAGGLVHPDEEPRVYGGVQRDLGFIGEMAERKQSGNDSTSQGTGTSGAYGAIFTLAFMFAEPALSFVGDTLTLPITLWAEYRRDVEREAAESDKEPAPAPPGPLPAAIGKPEATEPAPAETRESEGQER